MDPDAVSLEGMIEGAEGTAAVVTGPMRDAMAIAIQGVFVLAFIAAALGLVATFFAPAGRIGHMKQPAQGEEAVVAPTDLAPEL